MTLSIILGSAFCATALIALHYFPWPKRLTRPIAYLIGTGAILGCYSGVCIFLQWWSPLIAVWAISAGAGVAVLACYAYDAYRGATNLLKVRMNGDSKNDA
jgi:CHASE2 domain-containing sensor protein